VIRDFYSYLGILSLSFDAVLQPGYSYLGILSLSFDAVLQPGCDGGSTDFPTRFMNNVSTF
jgi:hypothetical protein